MTACVLVWRARVVSHSLTAGIAVNLLTRYILGQFLRNIVAITMGFLALYILIDFFEKIDNFMELGKPLSMVGGFFLLNIPFIIDQLGPVCILLAGVVTLGVLNHNHELIALKACGIPLKRITAPIIGGAIFFTVLSLFMSQVVLPRTIAGTNRIWNEEVKGKVPLGIFRNGRYYYRGEDGFYSFARPDARKHEFVIFSHAAWDEKHRLQRMVNADLATWDGKHWHLYLGQVQQRQEFGYSVTPFQKEVIEFRQRPEEFFVPEYRSQELSLLELYRNTKRQKAPAEATKAWSEFYGRLSYITLGLPLALLGLPLLLFVYRRWGRDLSLAIPASCGLAFVCWGWWGIMQSFAKAGYLHPAIAAITLHLVLGGGGLWLLSRENT